MYLRILIRDVYISHLRTVFARLVVDKKKKKTSQLIVVASRFIHMWVQSTQCPHGVLSYSFSKTHIYARMVRWKDLRYAFNI